MRERRPLRTLLATLAAGLILAVASCGNPADVDGLLTDDWAALPEPVAVVPVVGLCHESVSGSTRISMADHRPVDCDITQRAETVHVGTFEDADSAPPDGSPTIRAAFAECDRKARDWVGGDWRTARLKLAVRTPTETAWSGGARWFRCDLSEVRALDATLGVGRKGSLKDALRTQPELLYGCFKVILAPDDTVASIPGTTCDRPHESEFVGIHTTKHVTYEAFLDDEAATHTACLRLVAAYAKVPVDGDLEYRAGTLFYEPDEAAWTAGDRGVRCLLWMPDQLTRSVRGGGDNALPVQ
ncbi:septum formation family protein [Polymorphospora sp. NPDC050346]|uniref:septum formation family protein n=1 Tax=Polymorphospora sp. NPDC050346 TaxID=3155780 RepID=UPI0034073212